ncbi:MAG: nucleotide exchange factor GrpE [Nitrospirae bacterium]|nr:nucleotide exchange factor GrpE [Nitrospirota bacterium]MCL5284472.1 nucleotide exchange factor GrpE [Nitrospirota bacterium]
MSEEFESVDDLSAEERPEGTGSRSEAEVLPEEPSQETREAEAWKEKYIRLLADFDNHRKRTVRDLEEARKFANEALLKAFLPVLDNLERALQHGETGGLGAIPECKSLVEGVRLTHKQFLELLEKNHVTRVPSSGVSFDPEIHEAVGYTESESLPEGMVVDVYQQGYRIHNRLVRPSMVTVSKGKSPERA